MYKSMSDTVVTHVASTEGSGSPIVHRWRAVARSPHLAAQTPPAGGSQRGAAQTCWVSDTPQARIRPRTSRSARPAAAGPRRGHWRRSSPAAAVEAEARWRPGAAVPEPFCRPGRRPWVWSSTCTWTHRVCLGWCRRSWNAAAETRREQRAGVEGWDGCLLDCEVWGECARCRTVLHCACGRASAWHCRSVCWSLPRRRWEQSRRFGSRPLSW